MSDTCEECGGRLVWEDRERVCVECGLIDDEQAIAISGGNRKVFDHTETLDQLKHDRGLGSDIWVTPDAKGHTVAFAKIKRLREEQKRTAMRGGRDTNIAYAIGEIERIGNTLELSDAVKAQAVSLVKQAREENLFVGHNIDSIAAACVYAIGRINRMGATVDDIAPVSRADKREIWRDYKVLNTELGLPTPPPEPSDYVPRICSRIESVDRDIESHAIRRIREADETDIQGRMPQGVAAGAIYLSAHRNGLLLSQERIAEAAGVSSNALRSSARVIA